MTFAGRRLRNGLLWLAIAALLLTIEASLETTLAPIADVSGWALAAVLLALALYQVRRRLPMLPLGSSALWLQFHAYGGLIGVLLFLVHVDFTVPSGLLEGILAGLFVAVAGSGLVGLALLRSLPARLSRRGSEVLYERIARHRRDLMDRAEALTLAAAAQGSRTVADYYAARLRRFFERPRNRLGHLTESNRASHRLQSEMRELERYLDDRERGLLSEIAGLVVEKNDLDYHHALQGALRAWQFVHVPASFSLLILAALHTVTVYAFG